MVHLQCFAADSINQKKMQFVENALLDEYCVVCKCFLEGGKKKEDTIAAET